MDPSQRIAIVGIGGIFSQSPTLDQFWDHITHARDTARAVPHGRWPVAPADVYDPEPAALDRVCLTRGYYINDIGLDTSDLHIDAHLIAELDPVFHLTLAAARTAWRTPRIWAGWRPATST